MTVLGSILLIPIWYVGMLFETNRECRTPRDVYHTRGHVDKRVHASFPLTVKESIFCCHVWCLHRTYMENYERCVLVEWWR